MPREIDLELQGRIRQLSEQNWSARSISLHLLTEKNIKISHTTVLNVIKNNGKSRQARQHGLVYKPKSPPRKLTEDKLKELERLTSDPNPVTQEEMARLLGVTQQAISKIIKQKLNKNMRKKLKVHSLTTSDKKNRKTNSRKLYELLRKQQLEYVVTLDETMMYLVKDSQSEYCYLKRGEQLPDNCVIACKEIFRERAMVIGGLSGRGRLPLLLIPKNVKIDAINYVDYVLKPYIEQYLPKIYPNDMNKLLLHYDKASTHTSDYTTKYLENLQTKIGITFIRKKNIPVKGADISPLDFYGFGYVKQQAKRNHASSLKELWDSWNQIWSEITPEMCTKVFRSWKIRLLNVYRKDGGHIEHLKSIHKRKVNQQH